MQWVPAQESWFHGVVSLENLDGALKPWRIPYREKVLFPPEEAVPHRASQAAGVRLIVETDSPTLRCAVLFEEIEHPALLDLRREGELIETVEASPGDEVVSFENLGRDFHRYEIWLPLFASLRVRGIHIEDGARLEPSGKSDQPHWVTYGSSITHCRTAFSPSRTWPAVAARLCDLPFTSLGYGGSCHLEPMVGRMLRDLEADL